MSRKWTKSVSSNTKGNLGPSYAEGEWVAFQTQVIQVDWANLDNLGVRFDFYDNDAVFYDLIRSISVGTALLDDDHGYPMAGGAPFVINSASSANAAQLEPNENFFVGFEQIVLSQAEYETQINRAVDHSNGAVTDLTRVFYVTKDQILEALGVDEANAPDDIVLYFQLHLARTWIWNNINGNGYALAHAYDQAPTDAWGGYIYGDGGILPQGFTAMGAAEYPGSSGHSYVFINDGESGEKTIPVPNVEETSGTISGHKYLDSNGDGIFNTGDEPLAGWDIFLRTDLYAIQDVEFSTETDADGYYEFTNLPYNLIWELSEEGQEGYTQTYPNGSTLGDGVFDPNPNSETDFWAVPLDVAGDSSYDGDNRGPFGWNVKIAPPSHLVRTNMDFMNSNLGALKITKSFLNDSSFAAEIRH